MKTIFQIVNSFDLFHNSFQNEDRIEVTEEDILTESRQLTMAVKAAQLDDYPESHSLRQNIQLAGHILTTEYV